MKAAFIEGEIGMHIFYPSEHYVTNERQLQKVRSLIQEIYGLNPTPEVIEAFIDSEDVDYVINDLHGLIPIEGSKDEKLYVLTASLSGEAYE